MTRKTASPILFMLLIVGTIGWSLRIQRIKAPDMVVLQDKERLEVRVVEHKLTISDLEKLKQIIGIRERDRSYNQIINGFGTGLRPPTREGWSRVLKEAYLVERIIPAQKIELTDSVDHSIGPWFPPIGNQDGEGSCTAWAVGYYMKTFQEAIEHGWNLSQAVWEGGYKGHPAFEYQDRIFSPDFIYHQVNDGIDDGSYFSDAMNLVCTIGACSWVEMPYDPDDSTSWPSEEAWREAPLYRGSNSGIEYMYLETDSDINDLKIWIASNHLAAIAVNASQYSDLTSNDIWTSDNYVPSGTNHANTIVGYNDTIEYMEEGESRSGAFKIANSWGAGGWENINDGCYWISYEAMKQHIGHCMFYHDKISYHPELVSSFSIDHSKRGECDITFGIGNETDPIQTKRFKDWTLDGGNHNFCTNNIILDMTEFKDAVSTVVNRSFFMKVYDGDSLTTGTISSFSIEYYSNYTSDRLHAKSTCHNVPVNTINHNDVLLKLVLNKTWTVDDDTPADFHTIQEGINAASDGDTILVRNGTYYENVVVNKTVSLIGEDKGATIVDGNRTEHVIRVLRDNVSITGFTVQGSDPSRVHDVYGGIQLYSVAYCKVSGNILTNNSAGIILAYSDHNTLARDIILENWCAIALTWDCNYNAIVGNNVSGCEEWAAIYVDMSEHNIISGNSIMNNSARGIYLRRARHNVITENSMTNNNLCGISVEEESYYNSIYENRVTSNENGVQLLSSHENTITRNNITNNIDRGILLHGSLHNNISRNRVKNNWIGIDTREFSKYNLIDENDITGNNRIGILLAQNAQNNDIYGNDITDNSQSGMAIENQSNNNSIIGNSIAENSNYGIQLENSSDNILYHNNIVNNSQQVSIIGNATSNSWDNGCEGNYWSNYNGSDIDEDGIGDEYLPWERADYYPLMNHYWNPCDINHDLTVNMKDVGAAARAFGTKPGDERWNPHADLTGPVYSEPNGKVDMRDIALIARNFGEVHQ